MPGPRQTLKGLLGKKTGGEIVRENHAKLRGLGVFRVECEGASGRAGREAMEGCWEGRLWVQGSLPVTCGGCTTAFLRKASASAKGRSASGVRPRLLSPEGPLGEKPFSWCAGRGCRPFTRDPGDSLLGRLWIQRPTLRHFPSQDSPGTPQLQHDPTSLLSAPGIGAVPPLRLLGGQFLLLQSLLLQP